MKIILVEDMQKLGNAGDVVNVKNGYARNYLLPKKFAILATPRNLEKIEVIKKKAEEERLAKENEIKALAEKLSGTELVFVKKADEEGHLFGSVSEVDIVNALSEKGFEIHKSNIVLEKHIKEICEIDVTVKFSNEISSVIKVKVEKDN